MFYWILLGLAIAAEITGTLSMKWASVGHGNSGFILMLVMIALSYIFLSFAVKKIALSCRAIFYCLNFNNLQSKRLYLPHCNKQPILL